MAYFIVAICIVLETIEQTFFSLSGKGSHATRWLMMGIGIHVIAAALWFWLLTLLPLGIAVPLLGTSYATVAIVSKKLFNETVDKWRWAGIFCIMVGLVLVASAID